MATGIQEAAEADNSVAVFTNWPGSLRAFSHSAKHVLKRVFRWSYIMHLRFVLPSVGLFNHLPERESCLSGSVWRNHTEWSSFMQWWRRDFSPSCWTLILISTGVQRFEANRGSAVLVGKHYFSLHLESHLGGVWFDSASRMKSGGTDRVSLSYRFHFLAVAWGMDTSPNNFLTDFLPKPPPKNWKFVF